jgi:uncharacterized protein
MRLTIAGAAALVFAMAGAAWPGEKPITIGTGGQAGIYFFLGQSICALVNKGSDENNLKCTAPATGGSVPNLNAVMTGNETMGIAKSDLEYQAYTGTGKFQGLKFDKLRSVFSVHPEPLTVVVRAGSGVKRFDDLKGKRISVGAEGSSQRAALDALLGVKGWTLGDFALASELKPAEQAAALCENKVDAIVYAVGNPNGSIEEAANKCGAILVPIDTADIEKLIARYPYYTKFAIPGGMYKGTPNDVESFGVRAVLVTSADVDEALVYQVVKAVFDNFDHFKELHPAFAALMPQQMVKSDLSAPLHPGAERYFKEKGWL